MKITFVTVLISLLPMISILSLSYFFSASNQVHTPAFQPPGWIFGVVWTIVSLVFGTVSAVAFDRLSNRTYIYLFYIGILAGLLTWLPLNSYKYYTAAFYLLVVLSYISVGYIVYLSYQRVMECVVMLPLPFWLIFASCLNGAIYDHVLKN
jgi:tryptophan-rich sensory protein